MMTSVRNGTSFTDLLVSKRSSNAAMAEHEIGVQADEPASAKVY